MTLLPCTRSGQEAIALDLTPFTRAPGGYVRSWLCDECGSTHTEFVEEKEFARYV